MHYYNFTELKHLLAQTSEYGNLLTEYGLNEEMKKSALNLEAEIKKTLEEFKRLAEKNEETDAEPGDYAAVKKLCEGGNIPRKPDKLREKMEGAVLGRFIGCTLGAPVESWSISDMEQLAEYCGMPFPPTDYWTVADRPWDVRYDADKRYMYTRDKMDGVPVDDDVTYTILGMLIVEKYGFDFTTEDVAELWLELLPMACTAEDVALKNLKEGIPANKAGLINNPFCQWIGAAIRADGFAFAAAGNPELAASMGYRDAFLTHRRNGIYGEMFWAAAEAAAFIVDDPVEALIMGLKEIPKMCTLYKDIEWALDKGKSITGFKEARKLTDERFAGMHAVHTNNNAALTVFSLMLGKGDFTSTISNIIAMGLDNDCTGATAGSIMGAVAGKKGIEEHWYKNFNNKVRTYINGMPEFSVDDVVNRFVKLAEKQPGR